MGCIKTLFKRLFSKSKKNNRKFHAIDNRENSVPVNKKAFDNKEPIIDSKHYPPQEDDGIFIEDMEEKDVNKKERLLELLEKAPKNVLSLVELRKEMNKNPEIIHELASMIPPLSFEPIHLEIRAMAGDSLAIERILGLCYSKNFQKADNGIRILFFVSRFNPKGILALGKLVFDNEFNIHLRRNALFYLKKIQKEFPDICSSDEEIRNLFIDILSSRDPVISKSWKDI